MIYKPNTTEAFSSVENIVRDVDTGWVLRYIHSNGASFFFFAIYTHIAKGVYHQSFLKKKIWFTGLFLFILLMAEAFTGYVLPWGQMSFWAATVITNFFSIIPLIGTYVTEFIWGGFTVNESTLKRFFSIHFTVGFFIAAIAALHIIVLHDKGSNTPRNEHFNKHKSNFILLYGEETILTVLVFFVIFSLVIFYRPNFFMHPANYIPADFLVTPPHIVPEWYFLPFYTILRIIPDKTYGILLMGLSILIFFFLPLFGTRYMTKSKTWNVLYTTFICNFFVLGYLGSCEAEPIYIYYGQVSAIYYFGFLVFILPVVKLSNRRIRGVPYLKKHNL